MSSVYMYAFVMRERARPNDRQEHSPRTIIKNSRRKLSCRTFAIGYGEVISRLRQSPTSSSRTNHHSYRRTRVRFMGLEKRWTNERHSSPNACMRCCAEWTRLMHAFHYSSKLDRNSVAKPDGLPELLHALRVRYTRDARVPVCKRAPLALHRRCEFACTAFKDGVAIRIHVVGKEKIQN